MGEVTEVVAVPTVLVAEGEVAVVMAASLVGVVVVVGVTAVVVVGEEAVVEVAEVVSVHTVLVANGVVEGETGAGAGVAGELAAELASGVRSAAGVAVVLGLAGPGPGRECERTTAGGLVGTLAGHGATLW